MLKIALTCSTEPKNYYIRTRYSRVLLQYAQEAGVEILPVVLPLVEQEEVIRRYAEEFDGFIFTGGDDLEPSTYGEETLPACGEISQERDAFELALLREVTALKKPVFGICRGLQVMNVFCGGTLWQDFPSQCPAEQPHCEKDERAATHHPVRTEGSLRELLGAEWVSTNSYHHQAVKKLGENLRAVAHSTEGYVEALEHTELPFFRAVQWHPELDPDEISRVLYEAFFREMK